MKAPSPGCTATTPPARSPSASVSCCRTPAAAARLPFALDAQPATPAQIAAEFTRVDALPMGRPALFYRGPSQPELPQSAIDSLLLTVLTGFEGDLKSHLPNYDTFPDSVKLALLDMVYNLGPAGLINGYPRLLNAVSAGNWAQAAAQCERVGPGAARNQWTRRMFLENVVGSLQASTEGLLKSSPTHNRPQRHPLEPSPPQTLKHILLLSSAAQRRNLRLSVHSPSISTMT